MHLIASQIITIQSDCVMSGKNQLRVVWIACFRIKQRYINAYGDRYVCNSPRAKKLWRLFEALCKEYGLLYDMKSIIYAYKSGYENQQLSLI